MQQGIHDAVRVRESVLVGKERCHATTDSVHGATELDLLDDVPGTVRVGGEGDRRRERGVDLSELVRLRSGRRDEDGVPRLQGSELSWGGVAHRHACDDVGDVEPRDEADFA
jgi:hypothetical protein